MAPSLEAEPNIRSSAIAAYTAAYTVGKRFNHIQIKSQKGRVVVAINVTTVVVVQCTAVVLEELLLLGRVAVVSVSFVIVSLRPPQPAYATRPGSDE